ncbi:MAG: RNA methyltransferase [Phormidesmis sp.]
MDISAVRIVLVAPAGPLNIGSAARVMKNFGLNQLVLVNPQCDPLGAEAMQMAVHAKDVLQAARRVETIPDALDGCCFAIATTARQRGFDAPLEHPDAVFPALLEQANFHSNTALIFGPEDRGLSNEELTYAQRFTKISTDATYSALNLAQAVAVCCYELYRVTQVAEGALTPRASALHPAHNRAHNQAHHPAQSSGAGASLGASPTANSSLPSEEARSKTLRNSPPSATQTESLAQGQLPGQPAYASPSEGFPKAQSPKGQSPKAQLNELEGYYQHLEQVLLKVEYLYSHTAASRMRKFRQLLNRAQPTSQEVAMLRGILRQTEWALSNFDSSQSEGDSSEPVSAASLGTDFSGADSSGKKDPSRADETGVD